jgi:hypothetical protein
MNHPLSPVEKAAKKEKQEREVRVNMARYLKNQQATLEKTARLRAQRLAQAKIPAGRETRPLEKKDRESRGSIPGLYQGRAVVRPGWVLSESQTVSTTRTSAATALRALDLMLGSCDRRVVSDSADWPSQRWASACASVNICAASRVLNNGLRSRAAVFARCGYDWIHSD